MPDRLKESAFPFHPLKGSVPSKREHGQQETAADNFRGCFSDRYPVPTQPRLSETALRNVTIGSGAAATLLPRGLGLCDPLIVRSPPVLSTRRSSPPHYCRPTRSKIIRARFTLSDTTAVRRDDGRLISGSRARRTAAIIAAAMTRVDFIRACSSIFSAQATRSRAMARFISPIRAPRFAPVWEQVCARDFLGKSRMEGSSSSLRRAGNVRQSRNPASRLPARGCSRRTFCKGS